MTSESQRLANRANARASSGPKSVSGKARASKNALKHGLSIPIESDPLLSRRAALLVEKLCGDDRTPEIRGLLICFVEAQLEVKRARLAYHDLIAKAFEDPDFEPYNFLMERVRQSRVLAKNLAAITEADLRKIEKPRLEGGVKYAAIFSEYGKKIAAFARYERRALSRRKFAVRALDAAGFRWPETLESDLFQLI